MSLVFIMKKIFLIFLFLGVLVLGGAYGKITRSNETSNVKSSESIGIPQKLEIPSINVSANIERVELDEKRNMDVPKKDEDVGWYALGVRPAEQGSAVMAGHLDGVDGGPAVFWDLAKLKQGDKIEVIDNKGKSYVFEVYKKGTYDFDKFPLKEVFSDNSGKYLNLITCDGTFDRSTKNYLKRTVIYTKFVY